MLPSKNRLNLSILKEELNREGQHINCGDLTLIFRKKPQVFKAGVIVTKKVAPRAVDRNRIRRLVYEVLKDQLAKVEGEVMIIVKENIAKLKKDQVAAKLEGGLAKAK